jgi:hypothetical protein
MIEFEVDFNSRGPQGSVVTSTRQSTGDAKVGDRVLARDTDEEVSFPAIVRDIFSDGKVLLDVEWEPARPRLTLRLITGDETVARPAIWKYTQHEDAEPVHTRLAGDEHHLLAAAN